MPRVVVLHVRWPEGYFTDKYPSLVISSYVYSVKGEPLTVEFHIGVHGSCDSMSILHVESLENRGDEGLLAKTDAVIIAEDLDAEELPC